MKNLFLAAVACLFTLQTFSQETTSLTLPKTDIFKFMPIGENNGFLYYFMPNRASGGLKIELYKIKESTFELVERKVVEVDIDGRKAFLNNDYVPMKAYVKNNKFYFFYCVASSGDYYIKMTSLDENLNNPKTRDLGVMVETGYEGLGFFYVDISPDKKSAIVALKNKCERKKAVGTNTDVVYDNTELVCVDLISDKIVYSKRIPIELEENRVQTRNYKIDNYQNVSFIISITNRQSTAAIKAIGTATWNKADDKMKIKETDVKGSKSISNKFWDTKNGDILYTELLDTKLNLNVIPMDKTKQEIHVTLLKKDFLDEKEIDLPVEKQGRDGKMYLMPSNFKISMIGFSESENGYFITLSRLKRNRPLNYYVFFIDKKGLLVWKKKLAFLHPVFYNDNAFCLNRTGCYKNKNYIFVYENKPYDNSDKIKKLLEAEEFYIEYNYKKDNTIMFSIDEKGTANKKTINDNLTSESSLNEDDYFSDNGVYYTELNGKGDLKLQKIELK